VEGPPYVIAGMKRRGLKSPPYIQTLTQHLTG
jgi:hypothetical protein